MLRKLPNYDLTDYDFCAKNRTRSLNEVKTWCSIFDCISNAFTNNADYVFGELSDGLKKLSFNHFGVPTEDFINKKLQASGWGIHYVDGFISTYAFAELVSNKYFPVNFALRDPENIYYSPEPDFAHDVLGHVPMLFYEPFQRILSLWAQKAISTKPLVIDDLYYSCTLEVINESKKNKRDELVLKNLEREFVKILQELHKNPTDIWKLGNFFDWSFEFGIIKEKKKAQIFGGAIVTSKNEINSVINNINGIKHITLDVIQRGISYTKNQKNYYYVNDFNEYEKLLNAI